MSMCSWKQSNQIKEEKLPLWDKIWRIWQRILGENVWRTTVSGIWWFCVVFFSEILSSVLWKGTNGSKQSAEVVVVMVRGARIESCLPAWVFTSSHALQLLHCVHTIWSDPDKLQQESCSWEDIAYWKELDLRIGRTQEKASC